MSDPKNPGTEHESCELPKTTLGDYGLQLPIGVIEGTPANLAKGFAFKPYRMKEEKVFGQMRRRKGGPGNHQGRIVVALLAFMLTEWGGDTDFASKSKKHRENAILHANMVDVLYAYLNLRTEALGDFIEVKIECATCGHSWNWSADLTSLDFDVVRTIEDLHDVEHTLRNPIGLGEHRYDVLTLRPPTWAAVANISGRANEGEIKSRLILSSVKSIASSTPGANTPTIALGSALLDHMTKRDLEELNGELNDAFPSLDLSMDVECPNCGTGFRNQINWQLDFFFGTSSLPRRTNR